MNASGTQRVTSGSEQFLPAALRSQDQPELLAERVQLALEPSIFEFDERIIEYALPEAIAVQFDAVLGPALAWFFAGEDDPFGKLASLVVERERRKCCAERLIPWVVPVVLSQRAEKVLCNGTKQCGRLEEIVVEKHCCY